MTTQRFSFARSLPSFLDHSNTDVLLQTAVIHTASSSIDGTAGDDSLTGTANNDILNGFAGNDTLNGGAGADTMLGGKGDDTYIVDNVNDVINEKGGGVDNVVSSVSYTLGNGLENLTLTGTAVSGTGNTGANTIIGNASDNVIDGRGGPDHLDGGDGSDIYIIRNPDEHAAAEITDSGTTGVDEIRFAYTGSGKLVLFAGDTGIERVVIGTGTDVVADSHNTYAASVDATLLGNALTITGNAGANTIIGTAFADMISGGAGNDKITGGAGADTIVGGLGNDTLVGGTGNDVFVFDQKAGTTNIDTLGDFASGQDKIELSKAIFAGFTANGALTAAQFYSGANIAAAHDADDRIIFNTSTGALYYDADGNGTASAAVQIAVIGIPHPALAAGDIEIIN